MERRVTLRDIGKAMNCHHTTVSMALRNDPRLPLKTRQTIQAKAKAMGYAPDPMVKALMHYRTASRPHATQGVLAWLSGDARPQWGRHYPWQGYVDGAKKRADELGYRLEEFMLAAPGMTSRRMGNILKTRGIQGVIVSPQPWGLPPARIELDWASFSAVAFGYSLASPALNMVASHHFHSVRIVMRHLRMLGYLRIGLLLERIDNERSNGGFVGGYDAELIEHSCMTRLQPTVAENWSPALMRAWIKRHKPDALIVPKTKYIDWAKLDLRMDVPGELGMVALTGPSSKGYAHIEQQSERIGMAAVDQVVGMIHVNARGIPEVPLRLFIPGSWRNGHSVRQLGVASSRPARLKHASH